MKQDFDGEFEQGGIQFRYKVQQGDGYGYPWTEHDGYGEIRCVPNFDRGDKKPGEVVLWSEGRYAYLYDVQDTTKKNMGNWGLAPDEHAKLTAKLGKEPTKKQIMARAVEKDMEFCRRYLEGHIMWLDVTCWPMYEDASDDENYAEKQTIGGTLGEFGDDHLEELAKEIAGTILWEHAEANRIATEEAVRVEAELDLHMAGL